MRTAEAPPTSDFAADARGCAGDLLGRVFDDGRWSGFQILVLCLTALAIALDGLDNQALGFSLPAIMAEWRLDKQAFAPVLAIGQIGMMFGTILGGIAGDRFGRKSALVASLLLFGASTLSIARAGTILPLALLRLLAGCGMGSAFPNAAALVAEFTPLRRRSLAVTLSIVCVPLGGVLGGSVAAAILPVHGWRMLFILAGALPLVVALVLMLALPESLRFLARKPSGQARIRRTLRRMSLIVPDEVTFEEGADRITVEPASAGIFSRDFLGDTLVLWAAFFFCLTAIYTAFGWLPTMLTERGFGLATASSGLAAFNLGGVVTAVLGGWLIGRYGSRRVIVAMAFAAALTGGLIALFPIEPGGARYLLYAALAVEGGFVNGVQTTLYALAAHVYPTASRSTGIGAASGAGRMGAILSSFLGAAVLAAGGAAGFHGLLATTLLTVAIVLLFLRRHVPARSDARSAAGLPALDKHLADPRQARKLL